MKTFFSACLYYCHFTVYQDCSFKAIKTHVQSARHRTVRTLLIFVSLNVATWSMPFCFWYHQWLHLWPLLTAAFILVYHCDALSTSCNPTQNLMGWSQVTEWAKLPAHFFQTVFFHNFNSVVSLPKCGGVLSYCYHICLCVAKRTFYKYRGKSFSRKFL
jgi:hypothetical protein